MGMAASQARLLQLTAEQHSIGRSLMHCSNQKIELARDQRKAAEEYNNAIRTKVLKWSNNGGSSYEAITYNNLMSPSLINQNQNKIYLITDRSGKVVISNNYEKYAKMISPDGKPCNSWDENRLAILSDVTGIPESKIEQYETAKANVWNNEALISALNNDPRQIPPTNTAKSGMYNLLRTGMAGQTIGSTTWADAYKNGSDIEISSGEIGVTQLSNTLNNLSTSLSKYFELLGVDFGKACNNYLKSVETFIKEGKELSSEDIKGDNGGYKINVNGMLNRIAGFMGHEDAEQIGWFNVDSEEYKRWKTQEYEPWLKETEEAKNIYNTSVAEANIIFTKEEENMLEFYDALFSSIADKGWVLNSCVEDSDYLNQVLQNNMYTITSVNVKEVEEHDDYGNVFIGRVNSYTTDIASNLERVYTVADKDIKEKALVEYEDKKARINAKEKRIDERMQNLETRQSAIKQMTQGIEAQMRKNIETYFNIMS